MALAVLNHRLPSALFGPSVNTANGTDSEAYLQGIGLLIKGDFEAAVTSLTLSTQQSRKDLGLWFLLQALTKADQTEMASSLLDTMQLDTDALANMAQHLESADNDTLIHLLVNEAIEHGGGNPGSLRWMGLWSLNNGNLPLGIRLLESVITDDDHFLWSQLGWGYFLSENYERAVQAFGHSVALKPEATLYRLRLAQAYQTRNTANDRLIAQQILKALVSENPNADAETWYTLGWNHYLSGQGIEAVEAFEKVVEIAPGIGLYRLRLAQSLVQRGQPHDLDRAATILRQLMLDEPGLTEAADLLSRLDN